MCARQWNSPAVTLGDAGLVFAGISGFCGMARLLAMLFHVDLGLMPLFRGQSPEINSQVPLGSLPLLFGARCTP